jgi:hypothetical protein
MGGGGGGRMCVYCHILAATIYVNITLEFRVSKESYTDSHKSGLLLVNTAKVRIFTISICLAVCGLWSYPHASIGISGMNFFQNFIFLRNLKKTFSCRISLQ